MEVIEDTLPVPLSDFLARPLFAHLSTVSPAGAPRDTPVWYLWEDGSLWVILDGENRTVDDRVGAGSRSAVGIVDFDLASGLVQHVGMRGRGEIVEHDPERAVRLLSRYLGPDRDTWDAGRFGDPHDWGEEMVQLRVDPETVVARDQSYDDSPRSAAGTGAPGEPRVAETATTAPLGHPRAKPRP